MTADPLYAALLQERFGPSVWWTDDPPRRPGVTDARIQRALEESLDNAEEAA